MVLAGWGVGGGVCFARRGLPAGATPAKLKQFHLCLHSQSQRYHVCCIATMAEAIAAFSLAANVIQFIDFGSRVAANFYGYHKAASKSRDDAADLDIISRDLAQVLKNLQVPAPDSSINETGLGRLAQECQKCAQQMDNKLQPMLKARLQQLGKRGAVIAAFKAAWKEDEMCSLQNQLDNFRSQLTLHLLASLRYALTML